MAAAVAAAAATATFAHHAAIKTIFFALRFDLYTRFLISRHSQEGKYVNGTLLHRVAMCCALVIVTQLYYLVVTINLNHWCRQLLLRLRLLVLRTPCTLSTLSSNVLLFSVIYRAMGSFHMGLESGTIAFPLFSYELQ